MNNDRRKRIGELQDELRNIATRIEEIADEEREALENLPESIQESDKGQAMEQAAEALDEVQGQAEEAADALDAATEN